MIAAMIFCIVMAINSTRQDREADEQKQERIRS
jgi:large-conductance mechanosensitive channel